MSFEEKLTAPHMDSHSPRCACLASYSSVLQWVQCKILHDSPEAHRPHLGMPPREGLDRGWKTPIFLNLPKHETWPHKSEFADPPSPRPPEDFQVLEREAVVEHDHYFSSKCVFVTPALVARTEHVGVVLSTGRWHGGAPGESEGLCAKPVCLL